MKQELSYDYIGKHTLKVCKQLYLTNTRGKPLVVVNVMDKEDDHVEIIYRHLHKTDQKAITIPRILFDAWKERSIRVKAN